MAQQTGEPSVEDILATIRKVVAGEGTGARPARAAAAAAEDDDEVLELTEVVEHGGDAPPLAEPGPLLSPDRLGAVRDALAVLPALGEPAAAAQLARSAEAAVERVTRELVRPMIADWLDRNLPPLVERLVAAEIARIADRG